jgi:hypothetical protein
MNDEGYGGTPPNSCVCDTIARGGTNLSHNTAHVIVTAVSKKVVMLKDIIFLEFWFSEILPLATSTRLELKID